MKIPGLGFSWKRALGVSKLKQDLAKATGITTTRNGIEEKSVTQSLTLYSAKRNEKQQNTKRDRDLD